MIKRNILNQTKRKKAYFDWINLTLVITFTMIGLLFVWSSTFQTTQPISIFLKKQSFGIVSAIGLYLVCVFFDYRIIMRWGYICYLGVLGALIFTILRGSIGMGAQRWMNIGICKIQPSELVKLFLPAFFCHYLQSQNTTGNYKNKDYLFLLTTTAISTFLVMKQPDLGTALTILFSALCILWLAGMNKKWFLYGAFALLLTSPLAWHTLRPYQRNRIAVFVGLGDAKKERYQIEQSTIAIGSGGLWGKGFLCGTQNKLQFLPEGRTDFIFSVIGEETGLIGTTFIILLYILLFARLLLKTADLPTLVSQLFAFGLIIHIILAAIINIAMVLGLLPIVGIPLPLISYGISNLWITSASLGLCQNILMHKR